jgi:hypothetical protein
VANLLFQRLVADRLLGDDALEALRFLIVDGGLATLEMRLTAGQELVTLRGELRRGHAMAAAQGLQVGATQEFEGYGDLALRRPPPGAAARWRG